MGSSYDECVATRPVCARARTGVTVTLRDTLAGGGRGKEERESEGMRGGGGMQAAGSRRKINFFSLLIQTEFIHNRSATLIKELIARGPIKRDLSSVERDLSSVKELIARGPINICAILVLGHYPVLSLSDTRCGMHVRYASLTSARSHLCMTCFIMMFSAASYYTPTKAL
jgi:hypothetical protein